jgi:CHAT domain-containing protein
MAKVKVLFLAADPFKQNALSLDEEIRAITARIRAAEHRDRLDLVSAFAVRPDDLQQLLLQHRPHVVHFSGHASQAEQLILQDQDGQPKPVSKDALTNLFEVLKRNIRVVVLNACDTTPQAEAIAKVIDCAIGMNTEIGDAAARVFAAAFYQALGHSCSVQEAFDLGKNALMLEGIPEEQTPELHHRENVDPTSLILVDPQ